LNEGVALNQLRTREPNAITRMFRETIIELRKVSWPTRAEAISLTRIVIIVMVIMAALLGGLDALFFRFFGLILAR
jgi:preprotein translocase subunit SecE